MSVCVVAPRFVFVATTTPVCPNFNFQSRAKTSDSLSFIVLPVAVCWSQRMDASTTQFSSACTHASATVVTVLLLLLAHLMTMNFLSTFVTFKSGCEDALKISPGKN
jgi:hypothetical protein